MIRQKTAKEVLQMTFALCDDNNAFLDSLYESIMNYCAYHDWTCTIRRFNSPENLLKTDLSTIQVVFLDIDMPEISGIDVAKRIRINYPDLIVVFVTGFIKYAPKGYCVNAFRYLLKNQLAEELPLCMDSIWEKLFVHHESILIEQPEQTLQLRICDILYFEGTSKRRVLLHTVQSKSPVRECIGKLSEYDAKLASKGFLRIQKSYLVNMAHIIKIKSYIATLDSGEKLSVSEHNYNQICQQLALWKGQSI